MLPDSGQKSPHGGLCRQGRPNVTQFRNLTVCEGHGVGELNKIYNISKKVQILSPPSIFQKKVH